MENLLAYTAGYLDGDGCFYLGKTYKPRIKYRGLIVVSSVNFEIVQFFAEHFGGRAYCASKNERYANYRPIYQWRLAQREALPFAKKVSPYLVEKRTDAELFIQFIEEPNKERKEAIQLELKEMRHQTHYITEYIFEDIKSTAKEAVPVEKDFAYLAGFIDAECSFCIQTDKPKNRPNKTYKCLLQCVNTKPECFYWLKKHIGGFVGFQSSKKLRNRNKMNWRISARALMLLLPKIYPFLKAKKQVCKKLMDLAETIIPNGGARHTDIFRKSYALVLSKREAIVTEVHKLNSRGINHI